MKRVSYIRDKDGNILTVREVLKDEAKGWKGTFKQFGRECLQCAEEFVSECESGVSDFGRELGGARKRKGAAERKMKKPKTRRQR